MKCVTRVMNREYLCQSYRVEIRSSDQIRSDQVRSGQLRLAIQAQAQNFTTTSIRDYSALPLKCTIYISQL
jgi:hypothetical protein